MSNKLTEVLRGRHCPQQYTKEVLDFGSMLIRCRVVKKCKSGSYRKRGIRRRDVVIRQTKTPKSLEIWFRDGEGTYKWHAVLNDEVHLSECLSALERDIRNFNPLLKIRRHGEFTNKEPLIPNQDEQTEVPMEKQSKVGRAKKTRGKLFITGGKVLTPNSLLEESDRDQAKTSTNEANLKDRKSIVMKGDIAIQEKSPQEQKNPPSFTPPTFGPHLVLKHIIEGLKSDREHIVRLIQEWNDTVMWMMGKFSDVLTEQELSDIKKQLHLQ